MHSLTCRPMPTRAAPVLTLQYAGPMQVKGSVHSLTCSHPHEISMLWWLWLVASCSNLKCLMGVTEAGQEQKVTKGTMEISQRIADHLGEGCVLPSSHTKHKELMSSQVKRSTVVPQALTHPRKTGIYMELVFCDHGAKRPKTSSI